MGFEVNKIFAAVLLALIVMMGGQLISEIIIYVRPVAKNAYPISVADADQKTDGASDAPAVLDPITPLLAKADAKKGEEISKRCVQCHSFEKGGQNKVGPNLWGIVGAKLGHIAGFAYSEALLKKGGQWDHESLNAFLAAPKSYIPGTKMAYAGLSKAQERADLIAYLRSITDNPPPLK